MKFFPGVEAGRFGVSVDQYSLIMRPSSLGGGRILRRTLSVRLSVCPSVPLSLPSVTWRHLANYNDTHVLFGSRRGPHIVRPSRPHKLVLEYDVHIARLY